MGIKEVATARPTVYAFNLSQFILEDGWNSRVHNDEYREHIDNLKEAIKNRLELSTSQGLKPDLGIPAIVGRFNGESFVVRDGFSRLTALRELASEGVEIPPVVVSTLPEQPASEDVLIQISANSGKPLSVAEQAEVCKKFIDAFLVENLEASLTDAKEAFRQSLKGVSRQHIQNLLHLVNAPEEIKTLVAENKISASTAIEAIKDYGVEAAEEVITEAVEKALENGKEKVTGKNLEAVAESNGVEKQRKEKKPKEFTEPEEFRFQDGMSRKDVESIVNNYDFSLLNDRDLNKVLKVISL